MEKYSGLNYQWNKYEERFKVYHDKTLIATIFWRDKPKPFIKLDNNWSVNSVLLRSLAELADKVETDAKSLSSIAKVIDNLEK